MSNRITVEHDFPVALTKCKSRFDKDCVATTVQWSQLLTRLAKTARTSETIEQYLAASKDEQSVIKDVGGFVGGTFSNSTRRKEFLLDRQVICLDADTPYVGLLESLENILSGAFCVYTTHKHTPEAPRFRILIPLSRPVPLDQYLAIGRRLAERIGLAAFDPTTFEVARLMYWPSTASDGEYVFRYQDEAPVAPEDVLATYTDWRDCLQWPAIPGEDTARLSRTGPGGANGTKAQDPREIPGVAGAFCRAWNVPEAMDEHLPGVYIEGIGGRYTFADGSSANGVRLYDDGAFCFSEHSTDPAGGKNLNAYDLVRIHKFGHLDNGDYDYSLDFLSAPSQKAMAEWARGLAPVQAELVSDQAAEVAAKVAVRQAEKKAEQVEHTAEDRAERVAKLLELIAQTDDANVLENKVARAVALSTFDAFTDVDRAVIAVAIHKKARALIGGAGIALSDVKRWMAPVVQGVSLGFPHVEADGSLKSTVENVEALCAMRGISVRYDVIHHHLSLIGEGFSFTKENRDNNCLAKMYSICQEVGLKVQQSVLKGFLGVICEKYQYNPVAEWVGEREWDGRDRVDELLATLVLEPGYSTEHARAMLRRWLIQCVALACSPVPLQGRGVLVLQGPQNIGKSRWVESLCRGREDLVHTGVSLRVDNKDSVKTATSYWISELGELDSTFRRSDISALKGFLSQAEDTLRMPYAPTDSTFQRRTSFFASVNPSQFLHDDTGNTRFWSIPVTAVNHSHSVDMQQVWAQVHRLWSSGEQHYATETEMVSVEVHNSRFEAIDPLLEKVELAFAWQEALDAQAAGEEWPHWENMCATQIAERCGVLNPTQSHTRKIGAWIEKRLPNRGAGKRAGSVMLRPVPIKADEAMRKSDPFAGGEQSWPRKVYG